MKKSEYLGLDLLLDFKNECKSILVRNYKKNKNENSYLNNLPLVQEIFDDAEKNLSDSII